MSLLLDPGIWLLVLVISVLGAAGSLLNYYLGQQGYDVVADRYPRITPERWTQIHEWYDVHGPIPLFLTALPLLGILLTTAAGAFGIGRYVFLRWVLVGKLARNWLLLLLAKEAYRLFFR